MRVDTSSFVTVVIIANELINENKTSRYSFSDKRWTFDDKGTFFITNTATPDEASQSLNPRVC
jgi:hypothetical protein